MYHPLNKFDAEALVLIIGSYMCKACAFMQFYSYCAAHTFTFVQFVLMLINLYCIVYEFVYNYINNVFCYCLFSALIVRSWIVVCASHNL